MEEDLVPAATPRAILDIHECALANRNGWDFVGRKSKWEREVRGVVGRQTKSRAFITAQLTSFELVSSRHVILFVGLGELWVSQPNA
jgi:hypothetical protein